MQASYRSKNEMICTNYVHYRECEQFARNDHNRYNIITFWDHFYAKLFSNKSWVSDILFSSSEYVIIQEE